MADDLKKEIISYLARHLYGNLATISADNPRQPHASSIAYLSEGLNLYFATTLETEKFRNIVENPNVALTVDEDEANWDIITGLQIEGEAEVLPQEKVSALIGPFQEKFPDSKKLPPNPSGRFIKITPKKVWLLDYRKGFGHRDLLDVTQEALSGA